MNKTSKCMQIIGEYDDITETIPPFDNAESEDKE